MKNFSLITLLFLIGSGYFMRQEYPYTSTKNENNMKMFSNETELKNFYLDSLYRKRTVVCNQCEPLKEHPPIVKLTQYYNADFIFMISYSILFFIIAWYFRKQLVGSFKHPLFYTIIICVIFLTLICDLGENICMLNYISSRFENYTIWIKILNLIKSGGFIVLFFFLVLRYFKALLEGFNKCISTY